MAGGTSRQDAEGLHARLVWIARNGDLKMAEIAARIGRNQGTVSPWFSDAKWSLPDATGLIGLLRALRINQKPVSARWLLIGQGSPAEMDGPPGALYYRGAQGTIAELEMSLAEMKAKLRAEENGPTAAAVAASGERPSPTARRMSGGSHAKKARPDDRAGTRVAVSSATEPRANDEPRAGSG
jgi:hypothetical protein